MGRGGGGEEAAEAAAPLCTGLRAICVLPAKPLILHGQVRAPHLGSKGAGSRNLEIGATIFRESHHQLSTSTDHPQA